LMLEGPIAKAKRDNGPSSSFVLSVKNSYLEQSSKTFYSYVDENGLPFNFLDIYGKVSINAANGSKINFFGFNFDDQVNNYKALSDFSWKSVGGGSNFLIIPGKSPVLIEGNMAYSRYEARLSEATSPDRSSSMYLISPMVLAATLTKQKTQQSLLLMCATKDRSANCSSNPACACNGMLLFRKYLLSHVWL